MSRVLMALLLIAAASGGARAGDPPSCESATTVGAAMVAAFRAELEQRHLPAAKSKSKAESKSFAEILESRDRSSKKAAPPDEDDVTCKK